LAQIFPKWTNKLPVVIVVAVVLLACGAVGFVWYFFSPWYTDVGYQPVQPVDYSHKIHAGQLGLDCRYCHNYIEVAAHANVPPTQTCMNCHTIVLADSDKLKPVQESWVTNSPIKWVRVHKLPDYAYFDHSAHLDAGVGCFTCHGNIGGMAHVTQVEPLSMSWCLSCHRNPVDYLRPHDEITNMNWTAPGDQVQFANEVIIEKQINPPTFCSGCHR
jgi:hypothetical protein